MNYEQKTLIPLQKHEELNNAIDVIIERFGDDSLERIKQFILLSSYPNNNTYYGHWGIQGVSPIDDSDVHNMINPDRTEFIISFSHLLTQISLEEYNFLMISLYADCDISPFEDALFKYHADPWKIHNNIPLE